MVALKNIINVMLRLRCFPKEWKMAEMLSQNYRPIILLLKMSKIAEIVTAVGI